MNENMAIKEIEITLPDGSVRRFAHPVTGADVAASIGPGLAKAALAVRVDGELRDLARPITADARLEIVTIKDDAALELMPCNSTTSGQVPLTGGRRRPPQSAG